MEQRSQYHPEARVQGGLQGAGPKGGPQAGPQGVRFARASPIRIHTPSPVQYVHASSPLHALLLIFLCLLILIYLFIFTPKTLHILRLPLYLVCILPICTVLPGAPTCMLYTAASTPEAHAQRTCPCHASQVHLYGVGKGQYFHRIPQAPARISHGTSHGP